MSNVIKAMLILLKEKNNTFIVQKITCNNVVYTLHNILQ